MCYSIRIENKYIRLSKFLRATDNEKSPEETSIQCYIRVFNLKELGPGKLQQYKALSYLRGQASERIPILTNGQTFNVLPNLHNFLEEMRDFKHSYLWMDKLCID
jgi:hypothetical protein